MKKFPKGGILGKITNAVGHIVKLRIPLYASHACFFIVLALFPALVLLMSLLRYTGLEVHNLIELLRGLIPEALLPEAKKLIVNTYQGTSGTVVSISALTALWSASRGMQGLHTGLNAVYGVEENRGYFRTRLMSVVYTVLFLLVLLMTLVLHVFGNTLAVFLRHRGGSLAWLGEELPGLRYFLLVAVQTLLFALMFMYLPGRNNRFLDSLPGALFGSLGWMTVSGLFGVYVEHFSGYSHLFGPVYTLALAMLWLYACVNTLFFGGIINRWLLKIR